MATRTPFNLPLGLGLLLFLAACGGGGSQEGTGPEVDTTANADQNSQLLRVGGKVFSIPSPVQSALAIRDAGSAYQRDASLALDKGQALTGRTEQAIALGMYGADLAYATVHQDGQRTLATLQAIERLSAKLELGNAFDKALLERFKNNMANEDSLLRLSGAAFRAADEYLKTNERDEVSTLVLAGGWLEALHLSLSDPKAATTQAIVDRVGEQRTTLDGLVELLGAAGGDARTTSLVTGLKELQAEFKDVTSTYTFEQPVTDRAARTTYINSTSSTTIAPERLAAIAAKVAAIRSTLLA